MTHLLGLRLLPKDARACRQEQQLVSRRRRLQLRCDPVVEHHLHNLAAPGVAWCVGVGEAGKGKIRLRVTASVSMQHRTA